MDVKEPHHQWYRPDIEKTTNQSSDSNPEPTAQVTWSDDTKPPDSSGSTTPSKSKDFNLGTDLTYHNGKGNSVAVVYEEDIAKTLHTQYVLKTGKSFRLTIVTSN